MKVSQSRAQYFHDDRKDIFSRHIMVIYHCAHLCFYCICDAAHSPLNWSSIMQSKNTHSHKHTQATFILKKVMLVSRSTVDFRSWRRSGFPAGKLSWSKTDREEKNMRTWGILLKTPPPTTSYCLVQNIEIDYRATPSNHNKMTVCLIV